MSPFWASLETAAAWPMSRRRGGGRAFAAFLAGPEAGAIIEAHGFATVAP